MKNFCWVLLLTINVCIYAQKVEVLQKSGYTHNYVLGPFDFIEQDADTGSMKYVGTLRIQYRTFILPQHEFELCKIKGKDLGGNCFRLRRYSESDSIATLILDVWFSSDKRLEENKKKRKSGTALLFPSLRISGKDTRFYLNKEAVYLPSQKFYSLDTAKAREYEVNVCKPGVFSKKIKIKVGKASQYYMLGPDENDRLKMIGFGLMAIGENCKPSLLSYNLGRLLETIYKRYN